MRKRRITTAVAVAVALLGVAVYFATRSGPPVIPPAPTETYCTAESGTETVRLDVDQMANAATITAVGIGKGVPERAVQIALATALQESKLINLPGGDRDSIGLFQQRPSQGWGKPSQIADPRYAAGKFYSALLHVKGWQSMSLTQAAQAVQRSGAPTAYAKWETEAGTLSKALLGDTSHAVACYLAGDPGPKTGTAAINSLTTLLHGDWGSHLPTVVASAPDELSLVVKSARTGWQYAHWLVAYAQAQGVMSVTFAGERWTAKSGTWQPLPTPSLQAAASTEPQVVVQVYAT